MEQALPAAFVDASAYPALRAFIGTNAIKVATKVTVSDKHLCQMEVDESTASPSGLYSGSTYLLSLYTIFSDTTPQYSSILLNMTPRYLIVYAILIFLFSTVFSLCER